MFKHIALGTTVRYRSKKDEKDEHIGVRTRRGLKDNYCKVGNMIRNTVFAQEILSLQIA